MNSPAASHQTTIFPSVLDNTIISSWRACKQKCYRGHFQGLRPTSTSVHLHFGGAFAHGIEMARRSAYGPDAPANLPHDWLNEPIAEIIRYWGDYEPTGRVAKTLDNCIAALTDYFDQYPPRSDAVQPLIKSDGHPYTEFTFSIPLPINHPETNDPLLYGGRFDMLGYYRTNNLPAIIDEKTTGSLPQHWAEKWNMSGQFLGYVWACQQLGYPVDMVIVRGVAILKTMFKHAEAHIVVNQGQIDRWHADMLETVHEMTEYYKRDHYPLNWGASCESFGLCEFFPLCTSNNPASWEDMYHIRRWDPTDKSGTEPKTESKDD